MNLLEVISALNTEKWNSIVKSFSSWDVYYTIEYAQSLEIHGDGRAVLMYFQRNAFRMCYVLMVSDIADSSQFTSILKKGQYFDCSTPYGYGGPLTEGSYSKDDISVFISELNEYCVQNAIVSQFIRFHPLLDNYAVFDGFCDVHYHKQTVYIDTSSIETIHKNIEGKNRNMIRKAINNGVKIILDKGERLDDFIRIYESSMKKNHASDYYYFSDKYYRHLIEKMSVDLVFLYAIYKEDPVASALFFISPKSMHYHLSGTLTEFRHLAPSNLLLHEAATLACSLGANKLHLGGGVKAVDSLLEFKKQFNKLGAKSFYIGANIFMRKEFDYLVEIRRQTDESFCEDKLMIAYRG